MQHLHVNGCLLERVSWAMQILRLTLQSQGTKLRIWQNEQRTKQLLQLQCSKVQAFLIHFRENSQVILKLHLSPYYLHEYVFFQ